MLPSGPLLKMGLVQKDAQSAYRPILLVKYFSIASRPVNVKSSIIKAASGVKNLAAILNSETSNARFNLPTSSNTSARSSNILSSLFEIAAIKVEETPDDAANSKTTSRRLRGLECSIVLNKIVLLTLSNRLYSTGKAKITDLGYALTLFTNSTYFHK